METGIHRGKGRNNLQYAGRNTRFQYTFIRMRYILIKLKCIVSVFIAYGFATSLLTKILDAEVTSAGNQFAGKGLSYIPVAIAYGFIKLLSAENPLALADGMKAVLLNQHLA